MCVRHLIWALVGATISANSVLALESSLTVRSPLSATDLWNKIGDFCGMSTWDPAVERCDLSADGKQRTIHLFGGIGRVVAALKIGTTQIAASAGKAFRVRRLYPIITPGSVWSQTVILPC